MHRRRHLTRPHPLFTGQFIGSIPPLNLPTDYPFIGFMTSTYSARLPQPRTLPERTVTIRLFYWSDNPVPHQEAYARKMRGQGRHGFSVRSHMARDTQWYLPPWKGVESNHYLRIFSPPHRPALLPLHWSRLSSDPGHYPAGAAFPYLLYCYILKKWTRTTPPSVAVLRCPIRQR